MQTIIFMTIETCNCCRDDIPDLTQAWTDSAIPGPVCRPCMRNLKIAKLNLEKAGCRGIYVGPCPDNTNTPTE